MRADVIGSRGRVGQVSAAQIGSCGRLARKIGALLRNYTEAYLAGISPVVTEAVEAFLSGGIIAADSVDAFLTGVIPQVIDSSINAFIWGGQEIANTAHAFTVGIAGFIATSSIAAFILGDEIIKVFIRIAEMDRTFEDDTEM